MTFYENESKSFLGHIFILKCSYLSELETHLLFELIQKTFDFLISLEALET